MKQYIGAKLINATPMTRLAYNQMRGWQLPSDENGDDEGYLVEYTDGGKPNHPDYAGYISWSPKEQFDKAYRPTDGLNFGLALEALKAGHRVHRTSWEIRNSPMFLDINDTNTFKEIGPHVIAAIYPEGVCTLYKPNQKDVLADDWAIVS